MAKMGENSLNSLCLTRPHSSGTDARIFSHATNAYKSRRKPALAGWTPPIESLPGLAI
ncbi:hypothetical protein D3C87_1463810 [compost metagenome]